MPTDIVEEARALLDPGDERAEELIDQIRHGGTTSTEQLRARPSRPRRKPGPCAAGRPSPFGRPTRSGAPPAMKRSPRSRPSSRRPARRSGSWNEPARSPAPATRIQRAVARGGHRRCRARDLACPEAQANRSPPLANRASPTRRCGPGTRSPSFPSTKRERSSPSMATRPKSRWVPSSSASRSPIWSVSAGRERQRGTAQQRAGGGRLGVNRDRPARLPGRGNRPDP